MNAAGFLQKRRKINGGDWPAAHNGLIAGSSPGETIHDINS
jgi:hypothetical protein